MFRALPLAATLLFGAAHAQTQDTSKLSKYEVAEARRVALAERVEAELADCTPDTSEALEWSELFHPDPTKLAANPKWLARCVTVPGVAQWRRVMRDHAAKYEQAQHDRFDPPPGLTTHIGLAGHETMELYGLSDAMIEGRITGVLSQCEGMSWAGYCHYVTNGSPFIELVHAEGVAVEGQVRLVGDGVEAKLGNLRQLSASEMQGSGLQAAVQRRTDAILRADRAGFDEVVKSSIYGSYRSRTDMDYAAYAASPDGEGLEEPGLWAVFFDPTSPYRQPGYAFGERRVYADETVSPDEESEDGPSRIICTCLQDSCEGEWPISTVDIGPNTAVPMICEDAERYEGSDWVITPITEFSHSPIVRLPYSP